jgi:hypothetical protein
MDARSRSRSQSQASSSSASSCSFSTEAAARPRATRGGAGAHQGHGKPGGACRNRVVWCAGPRSAPIFEDLIDLCKREPSRPARASPSGIPAGGGTGIPLGGQVAGGAATGGIWALACQAVPYPTRSQLKHHARSGLRRRVDGVRLRLPVLPRPTARRVGPAPPPDGRPPARRRTTWSSRPRSRSRRPIRSSRWGRCPPLGGARAASGAHPPKLGSSLPDGVRRATANIPVPLAPATTILPSG